MVGPRPEARCVGWLPRSMRQSRQGGIRPGYMIVKAVQMTRRDFLESASLVLPAAGLASAAPASPTGNLPGTELLTWEGDLSERMMDGAHRFVEAKDRRIRRHPRAPLEARSFLPHRLRTVGGSQPGQPPRDHRRGGLARTRLYGAGRRRRRSGRGRGNSRLPSLPGALARPGGRLRRGPAGSNPRAVRPARSSPSPTRTRRRSRSRASPPASRPERSSPGGWRGTVFRRRADADQSHCPLSGHPDIA